MTGLIQGKDVVIYFQGGDGYVLFGCASDISISVDTELKSVKTKGNGVWKKQAQQSLSWSVNLNTVVRFDDGVNSWTLLDNQVQFVNINVRILFMSGTQVKRLEGELIVQSSQFNATPNDLLKGSFTLPGNGVMNIYNNTGVCAAAISDATIVMSIGPTGGVTFTANDDTAYITYTAYRNDTIVVSTGTVYKGSLFAHFATFGFSAQYRIEATPYCITDVAGTAFTKHF